MIITKKALSRRTLLGGLGATLAVPLLESMTPALSAAEPPAVRLGFVYVPNGIIDLRGEWTPSIEGPDFEFTRILNPLEPFRDQLLVLSGLAQRNGRALGDGEGDHARASAAWLTGVHPTKSEGTLRNGPSADQIAGAELGRFTQLGSLELGLEPADLAGNCDSGYSCAYSNTLSWRSQSTPVPIESNPRMVFERLFGDREDNDRVARLTRLREQRSVLDFVRDQVRRLDRELGAQDRSKLDEYLDAVREVERRIQHAESRTADLQIPIMGRPEGVPRDFKAHAKLMMDLFVLAFQTDITRVITFMMGCELSDRSYPEIGIQEGHHPATHHQNDPEKIEMTTRINEYHVETFAYLIDRLRVTSDAGSNLLNHSMILYGSGLNDGNEHTHHDLPLVLAGGGAGRFQGGRHIRYPTGTPMNNLLLSMLDKAGAHLEQLGDSTDRLDI